ncbi:MAG TPA: PEPxxWA-CTERM sorting domain-containing protein [Sphingomicrobium sp.]|nr:PEPxxWA-CTERM sorting domain-containing protein [Sphingomicrobium sp.]
MSKTKTCLATTACLVALFTAMSPANATVTLDPLPYSAPSVQLHATGVVQNSNPVFAYVGNTSIEYSYFSSDPTILHENAGGVADVTASDGGKSGDAGFHMLTIAPVDPTGLFSAMDFDLHTIGSQLTNYYADNINVLVTLSDNTTQLFNTGLLNDNGANKFLISGNAGELFKSITFTGYIGDPANNTPGMIHSIKQVGVDSVGGAVPEPSTWAMMLLGFGAVGFGMRRRKVAAPRVKYSFA